MKRADALLIALVLALGVAIGWQGWRSTIVTMDYLPYIDNARTLLEAGRVPASGHLASMRAFFPPGATYLFIPGMLVFRDIRLFESPTMLLSHAGSLVLLFLIARSAFGVGVARLSVVVFGVSQLGIMLWDGFLIGHFYNPILYLACVWCMLQWVSQRRARYLTMMLGITSLAMYVQHPMLVLMLASAPIVWATNRPPIHFPSVVGVILASCLVWSPYLDFERHRGFADINAMLGGPQLLPASPTSSWCNPRLAVQPIAPEGPPQGTSGRLKDLVNGPLLPIKPVLVTVREKAKSTVFGLTSNVQQASRLPLVPWALLLLIATVALWGGYAKLTPVAKAATLALFVPWTVLTLLASPYRPDRALWIWPMQAMMIAAGTLALLPRLHARPMRWLLVSGLVAVMVDNQFVVSRLRSWRDDGWGGKESHLMQAVGYIADHVREAGRTSAAVGYQVHIAGFTATNNVVDARYKAGMEIDAMMQALHGVANDNRCAEGLAANDEWRIVQTEPDPMNAEYYRDIVTVAPDPQWKRSSGARFGPYVVYERAVRQQNP